MDFEQSIEQIADNYSTRGYEVVLRPKPGELPPFARDFKIELLGKQRSSGVLVSIKRNREEFSADPEMRRYAEITSSQPGWRFDFVLLEGEGNAREVKGAQEPNEKQIAETLASAENLIESNLLTSALIAAWSGFEAAARMRVRTAGEIVGWGTPPRQLMNELLSSGIVSMEDFTEIERLYRLRNEVVHGFVASDIDREDIDFLVQLARRLLEESRSLLHSS